MKKNEKTLLTKKRILDAAIIEFGTFGYDAATMNRICEKYKIAKGLVYHNYKSKEELYCSCVEYAVDSFIEYIGDDFEELNLKKYMEMRYEFFNKNQNLGNLIFDALLQSHQNLDLHDVKEKFDDFNLNLYKKAIKTLKLRDGITEEDAIEYYDMVQNMFNRYYLMLNKDKSTERKSIIFDHENSLKKILDYMLYGIAEKWF